VNLERVEVIKGPASALFANSNPGGTINRVTKKPLDESRKAINFSLGSFNTLRAAADFTGPMNEEKTLLYRLNLGYENAETFRDLQTNKTFVIAPSFSFLPNEKTSVNFDLVYTQNNTRLDRGQPIFGATAGTPLTSTPISTSLSQVSDYMKVDELFSTLSISRKLTDKISVNASYMKFAAFEDLFEHRTSNRYATVVDTASDEFKVLDPSTPFGKKASFLVTDPTQMEMQVFDRRRHTYTDNITSYLTYEGSTGALRHQVLIGADYIQNTQPVGGATRIARNYRTADGRTVTVDRLTKNDLVNAQPVPNVPFVNLASPQPTIASPESYAYTSQSYAPTKYYTYGFYVQDQVKYGPLQVLLGLRQEFYRDMEGYKTAEEKTVEQEKLLPRIGAVYSLTDNVNFYATYTEGFQPQSAGTLQNPNVGGPFDPLSSNMVEAGAKTEWFNDMLTLNVAAYQIEQNNILVNANAPDNPDLLRQRGQERARGVEVDVYGNPLPNLSITANYAYNRTEITQDQEGDPLGLEGRIKENAPLNQAGIWARYDIPNGFLKGLGIGLGSNYVSERNTFATYRKGADGKELGLTLPAYTIFDAAIYYRVDKFRISANFNNLTDETHWVGGYDFVRLYPGTPRNYLVSVGYTF
jgi:iron complex outermembrane receptor protein